MTSGDPKLKFYPPRASGARSRLRKALTPLERRGRRLQDALSRLVPGAEHPELAPLLSLVPGLGHLWAERRPLKAAVLLAVYAVLGLICLLHGIGSGWLYALLFAFHNWLLLDSYAKARHRAGLKPMGFPRMIGTSMFMAILLGAVYGGIYSAWRGQGTFVRLRSDRLAPVYSKGDLLLIIKTDEYKRGDVVYMGGVGVIERVVALPGETLRIEGGKLFVDGEPLAEEHYPIGRKLMEHELLDGESIKVPAGEVCVFFPSRTYHYRNDPREIRMMRGALRNHITVPKKRLTGRVAVKY